MYFVPRFITRLTPVIFGCSKSIFRFKKEKRGGAHSYYEVELYNDEREQNQELSFPPGGEQIKSLFLKPVLRS